MRRMNNNGMQAHDMQWNALCCAFDLRNTAGYQPSNSRPLAPARGGEQGGQAPTLEKNQGEHGPPWKFYPWSENFLAIVCQ